MREHFRLWALACTTYITALEATSLWSTGHLNLTRQALATALIVPAVQLVLLNGGKAVFALFQRDFSAMSAMGRFFLSWLVLTPSAIVATNITTLVLFRDLDLTARMAFLLLFIPTAQAAVLVLATSDAGKQSTFRWSIIFKHPFAQPIVLVDAVILTLGWALPSHPLFGVWEVAAMQRRWMGTKLIVAAVLFVMAAVRAQVPASTRSRGPSLRPDRGAEAPRHDAPRTRRNPRTWLIVAALTLIAIGVDGFLPWIFDATFQTPWPLSLQPIPFVWLEVYGGLLALLITAIFVSTPLLATLSVGGSQSIRAGALTLFFAMLALMMNGFYSLKPIKPWAALAVTLASLAATCFAVGSVLTVAATRTTGQPSAIE